MAEENMNIQPRHKFDTRKDSVWERLAVERQLLEDNKWRTLLASDDKYRNALNIVSYDLYYLEYFYKSRYIEQARTVYPALEQETKNENMHAVIMWIENKIKQENQNNGLSNMNYYDIFRREQKRKLNDMLKSLLGEDNAISVLQEDNEKFRFGVLEFRFFSFLVDTYKHKNAWYLRRKKYSLMTYDYYFCLKNGVVMLAGIHSALGDPEKIVNRWNYDAKVSHDHLNAEIEKFKNVVDKAVDMAYHSDYSKLHLDYLADMISHVTQSIEEVFEL